MITVRRESVENVCAEKGVPPPPPDLEPWKSANGDAIFDLDHARNPVRWRFGKNGRLLAFIVYRAVVFQSARHKELARAGWTPIWDAAEKLAAAAAVLAAAKPRANL